MNFLEWLKARVPVPSARVYASNVNWVLKRVENLTEDALETLLTDPALNARRAAAIRTAWRHYAQYAKEKGQFVPVPAERPVGRPPTPRTYPQGGQGHQGLPPEQALAVRRLLFETGMTPARLTQIMWAHVSPHPSTTIMPDTKEARCVYKLKLDTKVRLVSQEIVDVLRAWAQPSNPHTPLLPQEPGSLTPMATRLYFQQCPSMPGDYRKSLAESSEPSVNAPEPIPVRGGDVFDDSFGPEPVDGFDDDPFASLYPPEDLPEGSP